MEANSGLVITTLQCVGKETNMFMGPAVPENFCDKETNMAMKMDLTNEEVELVCKHRQEQKSKRNELAKEISNLIGKRIVEAEFDILSGPNWPGCYSIALSVVEGLLANNTIAFVKD